MGIGLNVELNIKVNALLICIKKEASRFRRKRHEQGD
jgi:hypothetical protein